MRNKLLILTLTTILALTGCSSNTEEKKNINEDNNIKNEQTQEEVSTSNEGEQVTEDMANMPYTFKVPGKNICVNVPLYSNIVGDYNYQELENGYSQIYIIHGERYIAITAERGKEASSLKEAQEIAFEKFNYNIQNYCYVNSLNITKDSTETINGIEVYKFEGTLNCCHDYTDRTFKAYEAYAIGYTFIMDNTPCMIIGSVMNDEQPEVQIKEIETYVNQMISTLRSER